MAKAASADNFRQHRLTVWLHRLVASPEDIEMSDIVKPAHCRDGGWTCCGQRLPMTRVLNSLPDLIPIIAAILLCKVNLCFAAKLAPIAILASEVVMDGIELEKQR
jgi:hypothetical protein